MQRLFLFVLGLWAFAAGSILAVMIAGGRLHPDWEPYFDHVDWCGDRFCLLGIVPGVTSWNDAKGILDNHSSYGLKLNENVKYGWGVINQTGFGIQGQTDSSTHGQLIMQFQFSVKRASSSPGLTAGAFIARFGAPCFVRYSSHADWPGITLYYPFGTAYVATALENGITLTSKSNFDFNPDTPISAMSAVYGDPNSSLALTTQCRDFQVMVLLNAYAWHGFRSARLYPSLN